MNRRERQDRLSRLGQLARANQRDLDDLLGPDGDYSVNPAAARGLLRTRHRLLTEIREIGEFHRGRIAEAMIQGRVTTETTLTEILDHLTERVNRLPTQDRSDLFHLLGGDLDPIVVALTKRETNDRGETFTQMSGRIYS